MIAELLTPRLRLAPWRDEDRAAFAALNADPEVMEHFPAALDREESDALVDRITASFAEHGYGLWAVHDSTGFVGFTGLSWVTFEAPFAPALEIGWRLARFAWGRGYATEAATAALTRGFAETDSIVSFTARTNLRSERVMQRLGMSYDGEFDHPRVEAGSRLRRHVLYRANRDTWRPPGHRPP